jgi:hypothetical protein
MELIRVNLFSKFVIPTSDLSPAEIISRQGRTDLELDTLTSQEGEIKDVLMPGAILMSQRSSAHLALFSAVELRAIGDTRFRDSPNRFKDCI